MNIALFLFCMICISWIPEAESDAIACPQNVKGQPYGTVAIKCFYSVITAANKFARKYCCLQGVRPGKCKYTVISDRGYVASQYEGRVSMEDVQDVGFFTVTINGLIKDDQGTYICGIGNDDRGIKGDVILSVQDSDITNDLELVYAQLRGTVIFKCNYKSATQRKFLCKNARKDCVTVIDSTGNTGSGYEGRVTAELQTSGIFTVKLAQVRNQDFGYYTCGSDNPEESRDLPIFDVRINEETDIPHGSRLLTPKIGESYSAQCNYNPKKNYTDMFWCKLKEGVCNPIITSNGYVMDKYEGRVSIRNNATSGLMQVLMNNISKEDEGWYWCVLTKENHDQTSAIQVRISEDKLPGLTANKFVQVTTGDPAKLTCTYPCRFKHDEKYWCLWGNNECKHMTNVEDTQDSQQVNCQNEDLVLTIDSVSQKDSGIYWCGVKHDNRYGESVAVRLIVNEPTRDGPSNRANFDEKSGNVQVIDTPPSTDNNKSSTVTAVVVSVCAAVLVVCAVFLFLRLRKRKNSDLVSVGSYRTNISMTDLDQNVGKENPAVMDLQETDISRSNESPKTKKKGSREDLDYSCFLINHVGTPNEQVVE